jgi:hypothetical protein
MADLLPSQSPEWWIARLWARLDERSQRIRLYEDYYEGRHRLRFTTLKARETFGDEFRGFADNFCALVVDAVEERLKVRGFRVGGQSQLDPDLARMWGANDMDEQASMAHVDALVNEMSYAIVWVDPADRTTPVITAESPFEVIVEGDRVRRRKRLAALKRWLDDDDGHWYAVLYEPDAITKYRSAAPKRDSPAEAVKRPGFWDPWIIDGEEWPLPNPLGVVPVVPLVNMPRLGPGHHGTSEIRNAIPLQDAINKTVFDSMIASEFVAYPQRWMVGVELPKDEFDNPVQPFKAGVDRVWFVQTPEGAALNPTIGQFPQADLSPYVDRVDAFISHMAAITKTPRHYLIDTAAGSNLSSETVKALEAPLVSKARRKHGIFGVGWSEVMAIALRLVEGGAFAPGDEDRIEVDWADPETRTESQHIDALVKLGGDPLYVPREQLWVDAGYTPEQIARFKTMEDAPSAEEMMAQIAAGLLTLEEARAMLGRTPLVWAEGPTPDETKSLLDQLEAGVRTHEEVRASLGLPPIDWPDELAPEEVASIVSRVQANILTEDEARAMMKLPPLTYADGPSPDDVTAMVAQVDAGLLTLDEARAQMGLPATTYDEGPTPDQITSIVAQSGAGLLTVDEAREKLGLPPLAYDPGPSPEQVTSINAQIDAGLLTAEEGREMLGRPPIEWPEDLSDKVTQTGEFIKAGFDPASVLATLGLPPMQHLGLPPVTVQKLADAEGMAPAPGAPVPPPPQGTVP